MVQFFFFVNLVLVFAVPLLADLSPGQIYALNFVDVDGNTLSTADGHVTVVVLATLANMERVRTVGDRVPDYCLGNPTYRMITVLNFQKKRSRPIRMIVKALIRRRLDAEAKRLQARYALKKIGRDARRDIFAVADFNGTVTLGLGKQPESSDFRVFVFGRNGALLQQWKDVPGADELAAVLK